MSMLSRIYFVILMGLWAPHAPTASYPQPAFHGHPQHEERIFYDARTYSVRRGAFLSTDPANKSTSGYTLSIANPTQYIDPTGKIPILNIIMVIADVDLMAIGAVTEQPELDAAAAADLSMMAADGAEAAATDAEIDGALAGEEMLSDLGSLGRSAGSEARAMARTVSESASEDLSQASSDLESIEGAVENMGGGVPEPDPVGGEELPVPRDPIPDAETPDPSAPMENTSANEQVGNSPARTLSQGTQSEKITGPPKTLGQKLIGWAKSGAKMAAGQGVAMGGMYEITKLMEPSPPKKPIPKQK